MNKKLIITWFLLCCLPVTVAFLQNYYGFSKVIVFVAFGVWAIATVLFFLIETESIPYIQQEKDQRNKDIGSIG